MATVATAALLLQAAAVGGCDREAADGKAPSEAPAAATHAPSPSRRAADEPVEPRIGLAPPEHPRVSMGVSHACMIDPRGRVQCWGSNRFGQLGRSEPPPGPGSPSAPPAPVAGLGVVSSVAAGAFHTCALVVDGSVRCWGHGGHGLLGEGEGDDDVIDPGRVSQVREVVELAAGEGFTCARTRTGRVLCWGRNDHGQLGRGARGPVGAPAVVTGLGEATAIAAGRAHACAVAGGGEVRCWGQAIDGQVGGGRLREAAPVPAPVDVGGPVVEIAAGGYHTCARVADGTVRCFGSDDSGQLGTGRGGVPSSRSARPRPVQGVRDAIGLALGSRFSCVLHQGGTVSCFGYNADGQLGDGTTRLRTTPVPVRGLRDAIHVAAGGSRACAVQEGRASPHCW